MRGPQNKALTKENLKRLYVDDPDATLSSVADMVGAHRETVRRWVGRFELPMKSKHRSKPRKPETQCLANREWLEEQLEIKPAKQIAEELGTTQHNVWYWKKKHGLQMDWSKSEAIKAGLHKKYPDGPPRGPDTANWKGGRQIINGYVFVYAPDHPSAKKNRIQEHRLVMEQELGRYLESDEVVHHLNGIKDDNRPENLEVVQRGEHVSNHFKASHEVVRLRQDMAELKAENERLKAELDQLKAAT